MTNLPWLTLLWAIPVVGAAVIIVLPASARQFAKYAGLVVALAVLVVSLVLAVRFDYSGIGDSEPDDGQGGVLGGGVEADQGIGAEVA